MKIAAVSEDGTSISQHFGRADLYVVATVEEGNIVNTQTLSKLGHHSFAGEAHESHAPGERSGYGPGPQARHAAMMEIISDCQALLSGGMGWGAYEALREMGIDAVITDVADIQDAVKLYSEGKLPNLREKLH
jgi:predicted Fe-Mo cluster-binding NifX family protein